MSALSSFAEMEAKIIAKAKRGADDAGMAWLALHDAAQSPDGDGDLAARAAWRLKQRRNDEYRSRRGIYTPVAVGPCDAMTQKRDAADAVPNLSPGFVDDDKRVWTRAMIIASGLAGTRLKAPDEFDDDTDSDADARFHAAVEAARLKVKPRDREVLACVYDERLSVAQTACRVGKTKQAIYEAIGRIAQAIGGAA